MQQLLGDPCAPHRDKTQRVGEEGFLLGGADQQQEQLRHQDQAFRGAGGQAAEQSRHVNATGTLDAQGFLTRHAQCGPCV
ncbi:hypothetical protein D3C87_2056020 [compost metagenome]